MCKFFLVILAVLVDAQTIFSQKHPEVLPTPQQAAWADCEMGVIIHLDINIFAPDSFDYAKRETLPELNAFNPSRLNTDQWIRTAKQAGAKYAILTAKHGTGFCLWPSQVNPYNVGHTAWRAGQGDIMRDFIASCKKYGVKPGVYYNTNVNTYYGAGSAPFASDSEHTRYNDAILAQLTELWSNYGELFEIWFDGGVLIDEKKGIESSVMALIKNKQPRAILFQGPLKSKQIIRWVGNEDGIADYPQWSRTNASTNSLGLENIDHLQGNPHGKYWCPAESDFPIRRNSAWNGGWLWRANQENYLFSLKELEEKYFKSVGRNTNMLIGMVVDTSGLIPQADSLVFDSLGKRIHQLFEKPAITLKSEKVRLIPMNLKVKRHIDMVVLRENIRLGEHISKYSLEASIGNRWIEIASGQSVGGKRIIKFPPVYINRLRLKLKPFPGKPIALSEVSVYDAKI